MLMLIEIYLLLTNSQQFVLEIMIYDTKIKFIFVRYELYKKMNFYNFGQNFCIKPIMLYTKTKVFKKANKPTKVLSEKNLLMKSYD